MATREELEQKINKLEVNMNRTDRIVNGGEDEDVLIDGGQLVPSIRKWQKELGEEYGFPVELVQQAEDAADRAEDAASSVEQDAERIVQDVVAGVEGQVAVAQSAADRAETASNAAFVNADVYPDVATGRAAVDDTKQFQVLSANGLEIIRYRRDSASTQTEVARYPSSLLPSMIHGGSVADVEMWGDESTNIYNRADDVEGKVISISGEIADNGNYAHTGFIKVTPGETYTSTIFNNQAEYDINKRFIRRSDIDPVFQTWGASPDAYFVRLNWQPSRTGSNLRRVNRGDSLLPFEPYHRKLKKGIEITSDNIAADGLHGGLLKDKSIGPREVSFIEESPNLFKSDTVLWDHAISVGGAISPNNGNHLSDFIPVTKNGTYTLSGDQLNVFSYIAQYDEEKQFIVRVLGGGNGTNITVGPNCAYVRLMFQGGSVVRVFSKGTTAVPYQPYWAKLKGVDVELPDRIGAFVYPFSADGVFDGIDYSSWWTGFGQSTLSGEVYQRWDDLAADYPDVITKQVLGDDDFGNEISAYHISAGSPNSTATLKKPKIFITSAVHGSEKAPPLVTYLFFKDMMERADEYKELSALMYNADYIIIPVANPSGFNIFNRRNGNGVDINRNFPEGWTLGDPSASTYGGPSPLSEPEAQYISQVLDENPDISICYDFHNFHGTESTTDFIWVATGDGAHTQHMAVSLIERMTGKWRPEYPWFPQDRSYFAGYTDGTTGAMVQDHARARGVTFTATFEICYRWRLDPDGTTYDSVVQKTGVEAWANWLLINLRELEKITYR